MAAGFREAAVILWLLQWVLVIGVGWFFAALLCAILIVALLRFEER